MHDLYIAEIYRAGSVFIHFYRTRCVFVVQGHLRSSKLAPIDTSDFTINLPL